MANKQCKQDSWTQHTSRPNDPWQYQGWAYYYSVLWVNVLIIVLHISCGYWQGQVCGGFQILHGLEGVAKPQWKTSNGCFRCCCTTPVSSQRWTRRGSLLGRDRRLPLPLMLRYLKVAMIHWKCWFNGKVTESKPAVRAMSPERRGCLLKKETDTSLYEVTTKNQEVIWIFFRWSSSPTTRSPAVCLRTMWRSF